MADERSPLTLDHRSFATLVDEDFLENLGRAPAGTEAAFAAFQSFIKSVEDEKKRLESALKTWDGKSPNVSFLKDEYTYFLRTPCTDDTCPPVTKTPGFWGRVFGNKPSTVGRSHVGCKLVEKKAHINTVLNAVQIPVYISRLEAGIHNMKDFAKRIDRRLIQQDGKSRAEMVTAFQNAQGRIMRPEAGGVNLILPNGNGKEKRKSLFARPGDKD